MYTSIPQNFQCFAKSETTVKRERLRKLIFPNQMFNISSFNKTYISPQPQEKNKSLNKGGSSIFSIK